MPIPEDLYALAGKPFEPDRATAVIAAVTSLVKAYVRWTSGDLPEDLETVVMTASLRYLTNPLGVVSEGMGGLTVNFGDGYLGWSLPELMVLNRHRERAR